MKPRSTTSDRDSTPPAFVVPPTVAANPNPSVPLAAVVRFAVDGPVHTVVKVSDGEREWEIAFDDSQRPEDGLPVLGLRPNRRHELYVSVRNATGGVTHSPEVLAFTTPALPSDPAEFPPIQTRMSVPGQMEPGVTLLAPRRVRRGNPAFGEGYGLLLGLDAEGEVVWYYRTDARISDFERLRNGNLVYLTHDFCAIEIDMLGNVVASWYAARRPQGPAEGVPVDTLTFHHAITELPWGNLVVLGSEIRQIEGYYTSETDPHAPRKTQEVMGDEIIEFRRDGEVVWRWNAFEHLDPYRIGYETFTQYWPRRGFPGVLDWSHGNGLDYDERDDSLIVSLRFQDAIFKIDRSTGEIRWSLGEPSGWPESLARRLLRPEGSVTWPWHQHAPTLTPTGTLLVFDNGNYRARPFAPPVPRSDTYSRAVEYEIDSDRATVREAWASEGPGPDSVVTVAMGDAERLPRTGNVLVYYGACLPKGNAVNWTRVREYMHTDPPQVVWEVVLTDASEHEPIGWATFGGMRVPSLGP